VGVSVLEVPLPFAFVAIDADRPGRAMASDPDFDRFFLTHYDGLVRSLTAITGDRDRASDCVQEAFVRAFARWRRIRRYDNPVTWVRRVAINLSRDANRSDTRRRRREDHVEAEGAGFVPSPAERVVADMEFVDLLSNLTPQQRAVAALFYLEDLPIAEIAVSLGLSAGTVKFHLNKARASLKSTLETEAADHG
jgi:RNA polymerase sigma-70 factor (ECF subfamily)